MKFKFIVPIAAMLLASACMSGNTAKSGVVKGGERSGGFMGLGKADDIVTENESAFKAVDKLVVGNFVVGFATYKTDSSKAGGGLTGSGFGGKSTAKSTLIGIDNATMQKITDQAYADFTASMKAKGYTLVDRSALLNHKDFKDTKTYPNPYEDSQGGIFGSKSVTKYFAPSSFGSVRSFMDIPGTMGGFAFGNPAVSSYNYIKESGVKVISVVYVLDFANSEKYGSWASTSSGIEVGQGMTLIPEYTKISLIGAGGGTFDNQNGSVRLGQPITSEKEFATVTDSTSGTSKGVEMATNVIGLIGGIGSNVTREYKFEARPADFTTAANGALRDASTALVGKMGSLK